MQLKYLKTHISISSLTADPLPDFAVITGLNGSGKTHLLKAILSGSVQIEGVSTAEIVYFNYGNFSIDPGYNATQATDKAKHDESTKKLQALNKLHQERVKRIQQATQPQLDPYEQSLWNCLYSEDICETLLDVSKWETADQDNMNGTASIIEQIKAINPSEELSSSFIRDRWDSLSKKVKTQFDETYPGYYDFISTSDGSASGCLGSKFARSDFFAFDLAVEVRQYIYQQFLNDHNEVRATRRAENVTYLTPSQFLEMHGRPPLDILNDVLNEFDCNGYRFAEPTFYPSPNQPINNTNIPLPLIHKTKGYQTTIGNLSSGEQTLLALALAVYKSRKSKISRVLLLDEVDTALHPSMTRQMLDALYGVFVEKNGMKIIMATHSPSTVALAPDDSVFLLKNSEKISLRQAAKAEAIEFLTEGFATLDGTLQIMSSLLSDQVYIFSEGDNIEYLEKANSYFGDSRINVVKGIESVSGDSQLRTLFEFFSRADHSSNVFFVWDCDVNYNLKAENSTFPYIINKNEENQKVLVGIENLFPENAFSSDFYDDKPKKDGGFHSSLNKRRFTDHMISNGTIEDFNKFKVIFDYITDSLKD